MKALVLSGGSGTRLRPITYTTAKQLVPIANKPVLFYVLEAIADAGITEVGIVVGDTAADIRSAVGDGSRLGLDVTYIRQDKPLGLAHAVLIAREFLGDDEFVMYLGDNFIMGGINGFIDEFHRSGSDAQILLAKVPDPTAFGVVVLDDAGTVVSLEEKPAVPKSDLALVGVFLFTASIHEAVRKIQPSARGELEITHALQWLIDEEFVIRASTVTGYWKDTGTTADILEANRMMLGTTRLSIRGTVDEDSQIVGAVQIDEGARVTRSRIVGPVVIGRDCVVVDSYLGPFTSIADGCDVRGSDIRFSVVLSDSSIVGVRRVVSSLIGRRADVRSAAAAPTEYRLVLGDRSQVHIS